MRPTISPAYAFLSRSKTEVSSVAEICSLLSSGDTGLIVVGVLVTGEAATTEGG